MAFYPKCFVSNIYTGVVSVKAPAKLLDKSSLYLNISASDGIHAVVTTLKVNIIPCNLNSPR